MGPQMRDRVVSSRKLSEFLQSRSAGPQGVLSGPVGKISGPVPGAISEMRRKLKLWLGSGPAPSARGPRCCWDVLGVLESRWRRATQSMCESGVLSQCISREQELRERLDMHAFSTGHKKRQDVLGVLESRL